MNANNFFKLKKVFFLIIVILTIIILFLGLDFYYSVSKVLKSGEQLFKSIVENKTASFSVDYRLWLKSSGSLSRRIYFYDRISGGLLSRRYGVDQWGHLVEEINFLLPELLGEDGQRTYLILLQNDRELRPSGGFMGSYAKAKLFKGGLKEIIFQDIYVPDGQAVGHVEPPIPIQAAFKQGWWKLRDSNWDPDFPLAAKTIEWFFQKGGEEKADGLLALNFSLVRDIFQVLGPIYLADYRQSVDESNLYDVAQSNSEIGFFPGSTQKKEIINDLGVALAERIKKAKPKEIKEILAVIYKGLTEKQILMTFNNSLLNQFVERQQWNGSLKKIDQNKEKNFNDYLYLLETNLGANKANCCIKREVKQEIDFGGKQSIKENLKIFYKNEGKYSEGIPPFFWGGTYVNYLRVYLPIFSQVKKILVNGKSLPAEEITSQLKNDFNLQEIGFFIRIPAQKELTLEINYEVFLAEVPENYFLTIQKQPGIISFPYQLKIKSKADSFDYTKEVFKDENLNFRLDYDKIRQR